MMNKRLWTSVLCAIFMCLQISAAFAATLGPAETIDDLRAMLEEADSGDTLLISGDVSMDGGAPLTSSASVIFTSPQGETAILRSAKLHNINASFSNILLDDSLTITGASNVQLTRGVRVHASGQPSALSFTGSGTLIIDPGCIVEGASESAGISIRHTGSEFYGSIEGLVRGGSGNTGGAGVVISPLSDGGAVLIDGDIRGGDGDAIGGHALNLYDLSGNALITVDGRLAGGDGLIGGDGIQLISVRDTVSVGVHASVRAGAGQSHGGSAFILMNAEDSSSFYLSGAFSGGDAIGENALPGTSLQLVGNGSVVRTRIENCSLEEGRYRNATPMPSAAPTPLPSPVATEEPTPVPVNRPAVTPLPEITAPADNIAYIITPEPPLDSPSPN